MPDLRTHYLGLELDAPLIAGAGPLTGRPDMLQRLEAAGAAAVVLPSLFEEQIVHESLELNRILDAGTENSPEASGFFPELDDYNTGADRYLGLVERAKQAVGIPVIASLNGTSEGGWVRFAKLVQFAGADALELNLYAVEADGSVPGDAVERRYCDLIAAVRAAVEIPIAVKLSPFFTSLANTAPRLVDAGADGLVLFNRFYQPDIDLDTLEVVPRLVLSDSEDLRLPLRWLAILAGRVGDASLAATSGVHTADDALKALLVGADAVMVTSALLRNGPDHLTALRDGIDAWLEAHDYESVVQLQGSMSHRAVPDPTAFERACYLRTLSSFATTNGWGRASG